MTMIPTRTIPARLLLCLAALLPVAQEPDPVPAPDPETARAIRALLAARDEADRGRALSALRQRAGPHGRALVPQLLLFSLQARDTREGMAFGVLRRDLALSDDDLLQALVPLLESPRPDVQHELAGVLADLEGTTPLRAPDLSIYLPFLRPAFAPSGPPVPPGAPRPGQPPPGLVRHLYALDPGQALLTLMRLELREPEELRPILWAEHVVADTLWKQRHGFLPADRVEPEAQRELLRMSGDPHWWARLWAATILARGHGFESAEALERLRSDAHPLVREAATGR